MKKVLVTGGSGFIGGHVAEALCRRKYNVHVLDTEYPQYGFRGKFVKHDITTPLDGLYKDYDAIFHCAGLLGTETLFNRVKEAAEVNIVGTINVLNFAVDCGAFVVQPNLLGEWLNIYMISKHCAESIGLMYDRYMGIKYLSVRPSDVYGPRQKADELKAAPVFIECAYYNQDIPVYGNGTSWVNYIYVSDVARFLVKAYEAGAHGEIIDFCRPNGDMGVGDFAKRVIDLSDSDSKIVYKPMRKGQPGDIKTIDYNLRRANEIMDLDTLTPLDKGLSETIEWFRGSVMD